MAKSITAEQIDATCRTCMKQSDPLLLIPIFDASEDADSANDLLNSNPLLKEYFFNKLMIKKEDRLPQALCTECKQIVRLMVKFLNQCDASRTVLDNYLRETYKFEFVPMKIESESSAEEEEELKFDDIIEEEVEPDPINDCENIEEDLEMKLENVEETIDASYIVEEEYTEYEQLLDDEEQPDPVEQAIEELECDEGTTNDSEPKYNNKRYTCTKCDRDFKQLYSYCRHMETHAYEKELEDPNQGDVKSENPENDEDANFFECRYCKISFLTNDELSTHVATNHPKDRPYPCLVCGKSFRDTNNLRTHMRSHSGEVFKCDECDKVLKSKESVTRHKKTAHTITHHTCPHCSAEFNTTYKYMYHLKSHDPSKQYKCRFCDKAFLQKHHIANHERTHTGEKPFLCSICAYKANTADNLKLHMLRHKSVMVNGRIRRQVDGEKLFQCDQCGKGFAMKAYMKIHMRTHSGEKPFKCDLCERSFGYNYTLKQHKYTAHGCPAPDGYENLYECKLCDKKFGLPTALETHMKYHSDDRKYSCGECEKSFRAEKTLRSHIKEVHQRLKPYACDVCNKTFSQSVNRNDHMRLHTGEKPHVCEYCDKSFRLRRKLLDHLRTHTGEMPYHCDVCSVNFMTYLELVAHHKTIHNPKYMQVKTNDDE